MAVRGWVRKSSRGGTTHRRFATAILLGSLTVLALPGGALAAEPGLVGQWHFDEYAGSGASATTPDSSGSGGTGYFANTPTLAPGRFASAFNGPVTAEPMTVSGTSGNGSWALEPGGAVSLTAWVKYTGDPGVLKYIASKGDFRYVPNGSDCAGGSYALYTGYNGRPGLTFYVTTADGNSRSSPNLTDTSKVFDGQWHAVTGTYDGSDARLYVDGALVPGAAGRHRLGRDQVRREPPAALRVRGRRLPRRTARAPTTRSSPARSTRSASTTARCRPPRSPSCTTRPRPRRPT